MGNNSGDQVRRLLVLLTEMELLIRESDLFGCEGGDVPGFVSSFYYDGVASVGEFSCIQRVLVGRVAWRSGLHTGQARSGKSIGGRGYPSAVNKHIDTRHTRKSPSPPRNAGACRKGVAVLREVEVSVGRQWARGRLLAVERVDCGAAFAYRTHEDESVELKYRTRTPGIWRSGGERRNRLPA